MTQQSVISYVLGFQEIDKTKILLVGGKGANLGELSRIGGIAVPKGFCVTTEAYKKVTENDLELQGLQDGLAQLDLEDREKIGEVSTKVRMLIGKLPISKEIESEITAYLTKLGELEPYAVRSSATAEDLPAASFAGQQDTYLNIIGKEAILQHIIRCWASLFTNRAVIYRKQNGFDHNQVHLSVVIQKMVFPQAAGILFTADPITSNRKIASIDASFGLGEALVAGLVDADNYKVQDGKIAGKKISTKKLAIYALKGGGTKQQSIEPDQQKSQTLTDEQILALEKTGRKIEAYFGCPQDIEWCLAEGKIFIVQSRPITTLYPLPAVKDGKNHVYMSFGHQQNMTDTIKPLGMSLIPIWINKLGSIPLVEAGGRYYIDVSNELASPLSSSTFINTGLGSVDILIQKALTHVMKRKAYIKTLPRGKFSLGLNGGSMGNMISGLIQGMKVSRENDAGLIQKIITSHDGLVRDLAQRIADKSGVDLLDFILRDMDEAYQSIVLENHGVAIAGILAQGQLNNNLKKWLGEKDVTDILSQALSNNVTTEMGLAILDVADVVRQHPAVLDYFQNAADQDAPSGESFFEDLAGLEGGAAASDAMRSYLEKYGVRGTGEFDITRPRWAENPVRLIPLIINNIENFPPGSHQKIFEQKREEVEQKERELISRIEQLPGGKGKAKSTRKSISVFRNFIGFREYPKFAMMQHYYVYKQALLKEAARLVQKGVIQDPEDIYYLTLEELRLVFSTNRLDNSLITKRKADYAVFEKLTPPRVMTSDGEVISAEYDTAGIPPGVLVGVPVSSGIVEGRARIILKLEDAAIEEGDILVTAFTDPSWTSLFVSINGLVTEVGGVNTHGGIVSREYGLPAVASVENATRLIKNGQKIRVNGTKGYVEILE